MKKILIFFLFFILTTKLNSSENKNQNLIGCNNPLTESYLTDYQNLKIKKIEIDILNYRNWTVNNIKIITGRTRFINDEFKRKFKGNILVTYENSFKCYFKGKIRHSGDAKDHIALNGNSIIQSLDISLDSGHIKGITKFKLFKPDVRGNLNDVILQNQLLRNFGYLAPRSFRVNTRVNQSESVMLFQEKAAKELLEFNKRREGPILEGDQKFFFKLVEDIPDNNLSNWDVGTPILRNKSIKVMLSKLTNSNLINRGSVHKEISYSALNKLNLIYLYFANRFQDEKNNYYFFDYDFDNQLLGLFNEANVFKLNIYNLFMQSTNSHHALSVSNRKFYWNSIENFFEPITYDANPEIDLNSPTTGTKIFRQPMPINMPEVLTALEIKLSNININQFYKQILLHGIDLSKEEITKKIIKIKENLQNLKNNYDNIKNDDSVNHNQFKLINNITKTFNETLKDIDPYAYIVKYNINNKTLERCKIFLENCQTYNFTNEELSKLLEGDLKINNTNYQYLGKNLDINELKNNKYNTKKINFKSSTLFFEEGIEIKNDIENNTITINQQIPGSKAYFINGKLENLKIIYNGFKNIKDKKNNNLISFPENYPINEQGLTGCLSFINLSLKNININANYSTCEDAVNFINSNGTIENIIINESFSDGLDADFSNLEFKSINILSAKNDCADFSSGKYKLEILQLNFCGDKGLSVGEKSLININEIFVKNANIGIAVKDSSILDLNLANLQNLKTCLASYKKKQEYDGGIINIKKMNCTEFYKKTDIDNFSKILLNGSSLVNSINGKTYESIKFQTTKLKGKNFIKDHHTFNEDKTFNAVVEISSGTKEKWEVSKLNGSLIREFYMGAPRNIEYSPYPVNYGMIPKTILPISRGGDGDPLDVFILGEPLEQGEVVKVKALGMLKMNDTGDKDDKIIAVRKKSKFYKFNNIEHLNSEYPTILNEVKNWFENYKGKNVVEFIEFGSNIEANELIELSSKFYKRFGVKPRG